MAPLHTAVSGKQRHHISIPANHQLLAQQLFNTGIQYKQNQCPGAVPCRMQELMQYLTVTRLSDNKGAKGGGWAGGHSQSMVDSDD